MTSPILQRTPSSSRTPQSGTMAAFTTPQRRHSTEAAFTTPQRRHSTEVPSTSRLTDDSQILTITVGELKTIMKETVENASLQKRSSKQAIKVDNNVKTGVHNAVANLEELEKTWDFTVGFKEGRNPKQTQEVLTALYNIIGEFNRDMAYKACRTYFLTLKNTFKTKKANKRDQKLKEQRKRQRKTSSRIRRLAVVQKMKECDEKEKLKSVLEDNTFISSEESEDISEDNNAGDSDDETDLPKPRQFAKTILLWRSRYLNEAFQRLDEKRVNRLKRSRKGGATMNERRKSLKVSNRDEPENAPEFAIQQFEEPE